MEDLTFQSTYFSICRHRRLDFGAADADADADDDDDDSTIIDN